MARGWESKSVEEQQAQATSGVSGEKLRLTAPQAAAKRQRDSLLLSQKRVRQQLEVAQNPNHRKVLEDALSALEAELARMGQGSH